MIRAAGLELGKGGGCPVTVPLSCTARMRAPVGVSGVRWCLSLVRLASGLGYRVGLVVSAGGRWAALIDVFAAVHMSTGVRRRDENSRGHRNETLRWVLNVALTKWYLLDDVPRVVAAVAALVLVDEVDAVDGDVDARGP